MHREKGNEEQKHGEDDKDFWYLMKREREVPMKYESEHESLAES